MVAALPPEVGAAAAALVGAAALEVEAAVAAVAVGAAGREGHAARNCESDESAGTGVLHVEILHKPVRAWVGMPRRRGVSAGAVTGSTAGPPPGGTWW